MHPKEAKRLVEQVQQWIDSFPIEAVVELYQGRAWEVLNYQSWDDLCDVEFRQRAVRMLPEARRPIVASLIESGLSTRAVAAVVGVPQSTVVAESQVIENRSPVTGLDGKTYQRQSKPEESEVSLDELDLDTIDPSDIVASTAVYIADLKTAFARAFKTVPPQPQTDPAVLRRLRQHLLPAVNAGIDAIARDTRAKTGE